MLRQYRPAPALLGLVGVAVAWDARFWQGRLLIAGPAFAVHLLHGQVVNVREHEAGSVTITALKIYCVQRRLVVIFSQILVLLPIEVLYFIHSLHFT